MMMVMMRMMTTTTTTMTLCKEIVYLNVVKQLMLHVTERSLLHALEYNNILIHLYGSEAPLTDMLTICRQFAGGNDVSYTVTNTLWSKRRFLTARQHSLLCRALIQLKVRMSHGLLAASVDTSLASLL